MSLFVASNCQLEGDTLVNFVSWSHADQTCAIAASTMDENDRETNHVLFSNNEGMINMKHSITHDTEATIFDWHPTDRQIAIGWGDGMVSCWMVDGKIRPAATFSSNSQHKAALTVLKWNPMGKRLVTGDKKGVIVVWSADSRGGLNPIRQYKKKGEITSLVFCLLPLRTGDAVHRGDLKQTYSPSFFFGTNYGAIVYADDLGHCTDVQQLTSAIDTMLFFEERSRLVIITRSLLLTQYHVSEDGRVSRVMQVKLSVPGDVVEKGIRSVVWSGPGLLAAATEEKIVRLIDLAADESYNISLSGALGDQVDKTDRVSCVSFSPVDRYLAVGTQVGLVVIWKFVGPARDFSGSERDPVAATSAADWELIFKTALQSPVLQLMWHGGRGTVTAVTEDGAVVLNESIMNCAMCGDVALVQISSQEVSLHMGGSPDPVVVKTGMHIRGLTVGRSCFAVWSGKAAKVFRVDTQLQKYEELNEVQSGAVAMGIADATQIVDESCFVAEGSVVSITNFNGTQKGAISFSEAEGVPKHVDVNGKFLAIVTNRGCIKIIDVHNPSKPKQLGTAGHFHSNKLAADASNLQIRSIKVNCTGTRVAMLADQLEGALKICHPDPKLYIYDRKKGAVGSYDFTSWKRCPMDVFWDEEDDRLVCCEAAKTRPLNLPAASGKNSSIFDDEADEKGKKKNEKEDKSSNQQEDGKAPLPSLAAQAAAAAAAASSPAAAADAEQSDSEVEVFLFFATSEHGILMQDSFPRKHPYGPLLGLVVPRLYFRNAVTLKRQGDDDDGVEAQQAAAAAAALAALNVSAPSTGQIGVNDPRYVRIYSKVMRDFVGMDDVNEAAKIALLDFSYNLTLGKLDEAYRAVKAIDSPAIWENMAQMCVKTKRLDVAEVCLGNMGHARGAAAVRESRKEGNVDVSVGVLAIQLGLLDDAARLFKEANRFDMLNKLYQSAGLWDKAIKTARLKDRIHLKTTHYQYAKHLESVGRIDEAIEHYQLAETSRSEVPRMLFHLGRVDELGDYVLSSDDPALLKWWASYLESIERYDKARKYYSKAADYLSLVRLCCFKGEFGKAAEIVQETGDRASAYHFARQLENQGEYHEAINFYASSGCYNHSIRLARAYNLDSELMRFAMRSTPSLMIECAVHFERKGEFDKAVQLYHKGGDIPRALDLCFRAGEEGGKSANSSSSSSSSQSTVMFEMLNTIAQDLGADSSPQMLARCAEFLVQHKQFDKAIELYVMAKRYPQAIEMCLQNKVNINDEMVNVLTPPETGTDIDPSERKEMLKDLARALKKQGSFTAASKKYTQAGDRIRAIKCLVRSGDTKAVIQFASISRNVEIYKLAANYLQQMNWRESVDIMKAIIMFYTKAKAFIQLAGFYDSCAQVEIDEYRDYEKAVGALKEALKYLAKDDGRGTEEMTASMEKRILMTEKFVQARKAAKREPGTMVAICEALLQEPLLEEAVRAGDCLAMLVEHFYGARQMKEAYGYLQEMEERRIQLHPYVDAEIIDQVYKAMGIAEGSSSGKRGGGGGGGGAGGGGKGRNMADEEGEDEEVNMKIAASGDDLDDAPSAMGRGSRKQAPQQQRRAQEEEEEDEVVDEEIDEEVEDDVEVAAPTNKYSNYRGGAAGPGAAAGAGGSRGSRASAAAAGGAGGGGGSKYGSRNARK